MEPGDLVKPVRGRDKGRLMFILGRGEDGLLRLADGKLRRVETPKKKKERHVQWMARPEGTVPDKLRAGEKVNNSELRRTLSALTAPGDDKAEGGSADAQR